MGILNLTPDSFSDGQVNAGIDDFLAKAAQLISEGCAILDVGGESTRPDAKPVSLDEEKRRVLPFLEAFRKQYPDFPVSLDTKKYELAKQAMPYGIQWLNDVSCFSDERFAELVRESDVCYVLMHSRGDAQTMTKLTQYPQGVVEGVALELGLKLERLRHCGVAMSQVVLDLGFGFAKTPEQCLELIESLSGWEKRFDHNLLFGISRKRFLQGLVGEVPPLDRDDISARLAVRAYAAGFDIIRTHNVALTKKYIADYLSLHS
ncbi:MAG: hypothetical protein ACD_62C00035G0001 [uncultured bacterium]|nr:MAG: hypothetical protein ACD_62C00035G0001 [uncultured bacterium]